MGIEELTIRERINRYRQLAVDAEENAAKATDVTAVRAFITMAASWLALADTLERDFHDE